VKILPLPKVIIYFRLALETLALVVSEVNQLSSQNWEEFMSGKMAGSNRSKADKC